MDIILRSRLSLMMMVQYVVWGLWYSTLGAYMTNKGFSATEIPLAYSTTALASIISPFIVGMIADRFFSTQRVMAVLHMLGAIFILAAVSQSSFKLFFIFLLLHTLCYMPTLSLANSLSFRNLSNPSEQFPTIRVFGSLGWILAGFIISGFHCDKTAGMFYITAGFGIFMLLYCLTLPDTPPLKNNGKAPTAREILGLDALSLLKDRNVFIFMLGSFLTCIPLTFYFNITGVYLGESGIEKIAMTMTIGQWIEAGFFLVMPLMLRGLGVKLVLLLGMLCWSLRLFCFGEAAGTTGALLWVIVLGITLHGMSYDFFFVTGQIYIDRRAPKDIRSSAQGLLYALTLGLGMYVGSLVVAWVNSVYSQVVMKVTTDGTFAKVTEYDWVHIWFLAAIMALVVFLMFAIAFKDTSTTQETGKKPVGAAWGAVLGIVVIMLALSFSFQVYLTKTSTCAGLWTNDTVSAEITTQTTSKGISGGIVANLGNDTYLVGTMDNVEGTAEGENHVVKFAAKKLSDIVENGDTKSFKTAVEGEAILTWNKSHTLEFQFKTAGENDWTKYTLTKTKKVFVKQTK